MTYKGVKMIEYSKFYENLFKENLIIETPENNDIHIENNICYYCSDYIFEYILNLTSNYYCDSKLEIIENIFNDFLSEIDCGNRYFKLIDINTKSIDVADISNCWIFYIHLFNQILLLIQTLCKYELSYCFEQNIIDKNQFSIEAQNLFDAFNAEEINANAMYKNHFGLKYTENKSLKRYKCFIYLGMYNNENVYVKVSPEHYDHLNKYSLNLNNNGYAVINIGKYSYLLHLYIKGYKPGFIVDHHNGDRLDNTYSNLRFASYSQNNQNKEKNKNSSSIYIGVSRYGNGWRAKCLGKYLGKFSNEVDAALCYDEYVLKILGKGYKTNILKFDEIDAKSILVENTSDASTKIISKEKLLPTNISKSGSRYQILVKYRCNKLIYYKSTLQDAILKLQEIRTLLEEYKNNEIIEYNSRPKERNSDGFCFVKIKDNECIIDDDDYILSMDKMYISDGYVASYKFGRLNRHLKKKEIQEILSIYPFAKIDVDHIYKNSLDNRKSNLRIIAKTGNLHNTTFKNTYPNVYFCNTSQKWCTIMSKNYIQYRKFYNTEIESIIAASIFDKLLYKTYAYNYNIDYKQYEELYTIIHDDIVLYMSRKKGETWKGIKLTYNGKYLGKITYNNIEYMLGTYNTRIETALAYNYAINYLKIENRTLNIIDKDDENEYGQLVRNKIHIILQEKWQNCEKHILGSIDEETFKGTDKVGKRFRASIRINKIRYSFGIYNTRIEAAIAYNIGLNLLDNFIKKKQARNVISQNSIDTYENAIINSVNSNVNEIIKNMSDSVDTGGLVQNDWKTPETDKLALVAKVQPHPTKTC